jgi:hypothetical protein
MFDWVFDITEAWRQVLRVSEFTGISAGMLALLAFVVYSFPLLRSFAIRCAVVIVVAYVAIIWGDYLGALDKQAQWDAANARVAEEIAKRDADAAKSASVDEKERESQLASGETIDQGIIDALRSYDQTCHPITSDQLR